MRGVGLGSGITVDGWAGTFTRSGPLCGAFRFGLTVTPSTTVADTPSGAATAVAVVSDASAFRHEPGSSILFELLAIAELLRERTGTPATAVLVTANNADELIGELRRAAPSFSGAYITYTDPKRSLAAQTAFAGTFPVVSDCVTTAVYLIAAALATLGRAGISPAAARMVIVGAKHNPLVPALAITAGIGEIDSWNPGDAHDFPLRALARRDAIVINLLGSAERRQRANTPDTDVSVIAVDDPTAPLIVLPGLLAAAGALRRPPGLDALLATAQAVVELTLGGRRPSDLFDSTVANQIRTAAVSAGCHVADQVH